MIPTEALSLFRREGLSALVNHPVRVLLLRGGYLPTSSDTAYSIRLHETTGHGYERGGKLLEGATLIAAQGDDEERFDAADPVWQGAEFEARYAALVVEHGDGPVLAGVLDFGRARRGDGGEFVLEWNERGILDGN